MRKFFRPVLGAAVAVLAVSPLAAPAADAPSPATPPDRKDAAEKVQEGNVQQWIEYYQRTRPQAPPAAPPATDKPAPPPAK